MSQIYPVLAGLLESLAPESPTPLSVLLYLLIVIEYHSHFI
jgi:hypothetical protein